MNKYISADIKPFTFSDINSDHVVSGQKEFKSFDFQSLNLEVQQKKVSDETVRQERGFEKKNNFKIDDRVRKLRGLAGQEESDFENRIAEEVERRLAQAYQDAYKEGLEKGRLEAKEESLKEFQDALGQKVEDLAQQLSEVRHQTDDLFQQNRTELIEFTKRFVKWIVMKEVDDKLYMEKLLEKLILELNARKNLIIKVGKANFSQMPGVVELVESRLGQLQNVRIEIVPQLAHPGIILESESALIDGSLEGVFANIDKVFQQVIGHGE